MGGAEHNGIRWYPPQLDAREAIDKGVVTELERLHSEVGKLWGQVKKQEGEINWLRAKLVEHTGKVL